MSPEVRRQYMDDMSRCRHERDSYAKRAAARRADAINLRKERRWLDALQADDRASEYRRTRDQYAAEVRRIADLLAAARGKRDV